MSYPTKLTEEAIISILSHFTKHEFPVVLINLIAKYTLITHQIFDIHHERLSKITQTPEYSEIESVNDLTCKQTYCFVSASYGWDLNNKQLQNYYSFEIKILRLPQNPRSPFAIGISNKDGRDLAKLENPHKAYVVGEITS